MKKIEVTTEEKNKVYAHDLILVLKSHNSKTDHSNKVISNIENDLVEILESDITKDLIFFSQYEHSICRMFSLNIQSKTNEKYSKSFLFNIDRKELSEENNGARLNYKV